MFWKYSVDCWGCNLGDINQSLNLSDVLHASEDDHTFKKCGIDNVIVL